MITMHSILRDSYSRRAIFLDLIIFISSIIIVALTFADLDILYRLSWSADHSRVTIGILAIVTFFASIVAWRVNWKAKADAHGRAASAYTEILFMLRKIDSETERRQVEQATIQYDETSKNAISVPDSKFLSLKSKHLAKIHLSRTLDRNPAAWLPLISLRVKLRHTYRAMKDANDEK